MAMVPSSSIISGTLLRHEYVKQISSCASIAYTFPCLQFKLLIVTRTLSVHDGGPIPCTRKYLMPFRITLHYP